MTAPQPHDPRIARVIDREIVPVWNNRFARLILRHLPREPGMFALNIHCGSGYLAHEFLKRTDENSRILAIDPNEHLLEFARTRVLPEWQKRIYYTQGSLDDITAMDKGSYDVVLANLVLHEVRDLKGSLAEIKRITRSGGHILATLPLAGSWQEAEDIFAEILKDEGLKSASRRLEHVRKLRPSPNRIAQILEELTISSQDFVIEHETFELLFPSGNEFLFSAVVEHGPLRIWKAVIGEDAPPQKIFWRLKEAIDTYYANYVFANTIVAGLIHVRLPSEKGSHIAAEYWQQYPELDQIWGSLAGGHQPKRPSLPFGGIEDDFDLDIDIEDESESAVGESVNTSTEVHEFGIDDIIELDPLPTKPPPPKKTS